MDNEKEYIPGNILEEWFSLECALHKDKNLSIEQKGAMAWALLSAAAHAGEISWDSKRKLFGEFMAATLKLNFSYQ